MLEEMKVYPNWVAWKRVTDKDGKLRKLPLNPKTGSAASASDKTTWGSYDEAVSACEKFNGEGIGFEFSESPFAGIDIDNCIDANGKLSAMAAEIVKTVNSYTEYSPSEKGLHILFKLSESIDGAKKIQGLGLEMYSEARFFTITQKPFGNVKAVENRDNEVKTVHDKYWTKQQTTNNVFDVLDKNKPGARLPVTEDDMTLLNIMFNSSERGAKIKDLFDGESAGYPSESEADLAFCHELAFFTNKDAARMDKIFRQSSRNRRKWDEKHDSAGHTYGEMTIQKAIETCYDVYNPEQADNHTLADYLQNSLIPDFQKFRNQADRKTGFSNMDKDGVNIYPGLWVIGAVPSLGKTTFCTQLADNLAVANNFVLYFSFEMTEFELATKGLSRLMYKNVVDFRRKDYGAGDCLTAVQIRRGECDNLSADKIFELIEGAKAEYMPVAANEMIIKCDFDTDVNFISDTIKQYADKNPVVFVDYLQVIGRADKKQIIRDAIDSAVKNLETISKNYDIPIFVISSFNRENYLATVDFSSFKESGGIEYTGDVVMALQLRAMNANVFNSDKDLQIKREYVRQAKKAMPRELELVVLKNRFGESGDKYYFDYYAAYDYFQPCGKKHDEIQQEVNEAAEAFKEEFEAQKAQSSKSKRR